MNPSDLIVIGVLAGVFVAVLVVDWYVRNKL